MNQPDKSKIPRKLDVNSEIQVDPMLEIMGEIAEQVSRLADNIENLLTDSFVIRKLMAKKAIEDGLLTPEEHDDYLGDDDEKDDDGR